MSRGGYEARYQHLADEDLIAAVEGGDADAFAALYGRHGRAAYYFLLQGDGRPSGR